MSDYCEYCKHSGNHDPFCPNHHDVPGGRREAVIIWNIGWGAGRQAHDRSMPNNRTYMLGWLTGECAREEAENGCMYLDE